MDLRIIRPAKRWSPMDLQHSITNDIDIIMADKRNTTIWFVLPWQPLNHGSPDIVSGKCRGVTRALPVSIEGRRLERGETGLERMDVPGLNVRHSQRKKEKHLRLFIRHFASKNVDSMSRAQGWSMDLRAPGAEGHKHACYLLYRDLIPTGI